ncbi:hypothetical protein BGW38_001402 [Lunasporangiospora selenospora]|uniref:Uncharacterized protein n=1 Tax=Lunasporangiospora selenospora TaxID=979761 RepID=A0A9P6G226_9FUNG|nr:hypothetical protein BGW38_001402 [Lunasporangiospora selenospora]
MAGPSATVVTASLVSSGNNSASSHAIQLSNISRPAATRSGTNSTQSTGQLPINNGHSHNGVIARSGSGDLQSQRRSVSSGSAPFSSLEEYEAKIKEELCTGTSELRLFFERDPSLRTADYKGNTRRYAAPIELGEGNSTIIDISGSAPEGNLDYAIFCFLFGENSRNIKHIHVEGVLPLDIPSVITPGKKFLRVLLRVQLPTQIFRIRKERSNVTVPTPARLCYVELGQKGFDKTAYGKYCILPWTPLPRKIINVWKPENDNTPSLQKPVRILKYAVSASGNHVTTLAANTKHLYLDLWRVDIQSSTQRTVYPSSKPSMPLAQAILNVETPEYIHVEVSISWNGSQIAVYKDPEGSASRIQLFEQPQGQNNQNPISPLALAPSTRHAQCTELQTFKGYTTFTQLATSAWSDSSERFIIFDGVDVILYSTEGQWQRLYPIQIYSGLDTKSFQRTALTVAGGFFVSLESPYQLSLWNLESGEVAQLIDTTNVIEKYLISSDGKSVSILSDGNLRMYSTETGGLVYASKLESKNEIAFLHGDMTLVVPKAEGRWGLIQRLESGTTTSRQDFHCTTRERPSIQDIKPGSGLHGFEYESTIVTQCHGSLLDISFVEDILTNIDGSSESDCTSLCVTNLQELSEFREREEITFPGGTGVLWMDEGDDQHKFRMEVSVDFEDGMSKQFRIKADRFYFMSSRHTIVAISQSSGSLVAIWRLPASSDSDFELLLH